MGIDGPENSVFTETGNRIAGRVDCGDERGGPGRPGRVCPSGGASREGQNPGPLESTSRFDQPLEANLAGGAEAGVQLPRGVDTGEHRRFIAQPECGADRPGANAAASQQSRAIRFPENRSKRVGSAEVDDGRAKFDAEARVRLPNLVEPGDEKVASD